MQMVNIKRMFRTGLLNFTRNSAVSFASVLVMTITLSVLSGILLFEHVLESTLTNIEKKVDVTVYTIPGADESVILSLKDQITSLAEVADVAYVSEKEALEDFRLRHADDSTTLQALEELDSNPIGGMLNIRAKEISQYASIAKFFEDKGTLSVGEQSVIDHIDYNKNREEIEAIQGIMKNGRLLGLVLTLILMLLSVIVTFNTMRLAMYFAKEEIAVMRLVGASKTHVQGPFIFEGAMYGIVATIITLIIYVPITWWLGRHMTSFFGGLNLFSYYLHNILEFVIILVIFGAGLGALSSVLAAHRHLKR